MRLLVLGGTAFVGRAVVEAALDRGWEVVTFNRGRGAWAHPDVRRIVGDRANPATLAPLGAEEWDAVVDTWAGAPVAVRDAVEVLAPRAGRYAYVSSASVYAPPLPMGVREADPTVPGSPDDREPRDYAAAKRGGELAVERAFGDRGLLARCGAVLGPHEDIGRLPWWLRRIARGGDVLAPGPADAPLQVLDVRDLAAWTLDALVAGRHGAYNAVSRRGHATMRSLLETAVRVTGSAARLAWAPPELLAAHGVAPWTELPVWLPPDHESRGLHAIDVDRIHAAGFVARPIEETIADTWSWLEGLDGPPPVRTDWPAPGLSREREEAVLADLRAAG